VIEANANPPGGKPNLREKRIKSGAQTWRAKPFAKCVEAAGPAVLQFLDRRLAQVPLRKKVETVGEYSDSHSTRGKGTGICHEQGRQCQHRPSVFMAQLA